MPPVSKASQHVAPPAGYLGIECGGTRTTALLAGSKGCQTESREFRSFNWTLQGHADLNSLLSEIKDRFPNPKAIGLAVAGALEDKDHAQVRACARYTWPGIPVATTHDLHGAMLAANLEGKPGCPRVIVLSGTGSCCYGRSARGKTIRVGGRGHLLGDAGSGYWIGLEGLKECMRLLDSQGKWPRLGAELERRLGLRRREDLIPWIQHASKEAVARLAIPVLDAWSQGDPAAGRVINGAARELSSGAETCARRLTKPGSEVEFVLCGGVLAGRPAFAAAVAARIKRRWSPAAVRVLGRPTAIGAVLLARSAFRNRRRSAPARSLANQGTIGPRIPSPREVLPIATGPSPTEDRNPRSGGLDRLPIHRIIHLMATEDLELPSAILGEEKNLVQAVRWVIRAFESGGRVFYVGAGTSGRLGVLDASECPPTFHADPAAVQGIIAGGARALSEAVEGAEDRFESGYEALVLRTIRRHDVVVGIAASGRTPFVWGAMAAAKQWGARRVLICFNPHLRFRRAYRPSIVICPKVGPEVLTGSTRLKCGTATKMILNMLTTAAWVKSGKAISNLMVDLRPTNSKLRTRAVTILRALTGMSEPAARKALESNDWHLRKAWRSATTDRG